MIVEEKKAHEIERLRVALKAGNSPEIPDSSSIVHSLIRADQIPDEVVEAAARALKDHPLVPFTEDAALVIARASIAAALNAWPGALVEWHSRGPGIILPLPQEVSDE